MDHIFEEARTLEVRGDYDVVVAGGGFAGVAAAVSAARQGARTLLIEREYTLGGLGTLGQIVVYEPICDGLGHQVCFGLAEELLKLSIRYGAQAEYPKYWLEGGTPEQRREKRYRTQFNPYVCAIALEQFLLSSGVKLLYGTAVCGLHVEDALAKALIVENKTGRYAFSCKAVIDVTGDANLYKMAGVDTALHAGGNSLVGWHYVLRDQHNQIRKYGRVRVKEHDCAKSDAEKAAEAKRYAAVDAEEITEMMIDSHRFVLEDFLKHGGVSETYDLTSIATIPQVRMTRRICGAYTMDVSQVHMTFDDSVGMYGNWRQKEDIFEVPFRTLYNGKIRNMLTAGRSISVTDALWDLSRVIPVCAVTGEAAGIAAAISDDFPNLDVADIQKALRRRGVPLHESELDLSQPGALPSDSV